MNSRFGGQVVAVTDAGHGLGWEIAHTFARFGALVCATDVNAAGLAESALADGVIARAVDLRDRAAAEWIARIEPQSDGRSTCWSTMPVAGQEPVRLENVPDQDWNTISDINVNAAFALCRAAVAGIQPYCSAKHAVFAVTLQLARRFGIMVNSRQFGAVLCLGACGFCERAGAAG